MYIDTENLNFFDRNRIRAYPMKLINRFFVILLLISLNQVNGQAQKEIFSNNYESFIRITGNITSNSWSADHQNGIVPIKNSYSIHLLSRYNKNYSNNPLELGNSLNNRLGICYSPFDFLQLGVGYTTVQSHIDINWKLGLLKCGGPFNRKINLTYIGNIGYNGSNPLSLTFVNRISFFNELIIGYKVSDKSYIQFSVNHTHFNAAKTYNLDDQYFSLQNDHIAGRAYSAYKLSRTFYVSGQIDIPLTKHNINNPDPNFSAALGANIKSYNVEVVLGQYNLILPQLNAVYTSQSLYRKGLSIGLNLSVLLFS